MLKKVFGLRGGYYSLENETDVTSQFPLTYNGNSFTVQFDNIKGEGYLIKYDVKLSYTPVNQEAVNNRIIGEKNSQIFLNIVIKATYQESGGEANGYNFTIKIHKESEDGQNLKGAVFEVIRDSSHAKVGEITTDSNGNGSLGGLLKDNYTIREKKAPEGYIPLDSDIHVTPADFGADKAVLKTIKNKKNPKINICGEKTWDDADDQDGKRPASITVNLLADGNKVAEKTVTKDDDWKYEFKDLPKYKNGKEIVYTVTENTVEGYSTSIKGHDITNSYTPGETSVTVTKHWNDSNDKDGIRPGSIKVQVFGDGNKVGDEVELNEKNNWTTTWNKLPQKKSGKDITYTVKEVGNISGYTTTIDDKNHGDIIITNTHTPKEIAGVKTGDDTNFMLFMFLILTSSAVLGTILVMRRRKKQ